MTGTGKSLRVFISYARRDCSEFAQELMQGLEVAGFDAFLDKHDIAAGEDWEARLGGLIQSADTVVFVVSPAAVASERCAWEVQHAEALSKRIIPIVAIPVTEAQTPASLKRLNYIFFSEGHSFTKALGDLATALRVDLGWIREHTRLGELARRWQERNRSDVLLLRGAELDGAREWLAAWKAPAPEPMDLQRMFIAESEAAEGAVVKRERARQARLRWGLIAATLVFALLSAGAGYLALRATQSEARMRDEQAQRQLADLNAHRSDLNAKRSAGNEQEALQAAEKSASDARLARDNLAKANEDLLSQNELLRQRAEIDLWLTQVRSSDAMRLHQLLARAQGMSANRNLPLGISFRLRILVGEINLRLSSNGCSPDSDSSRIREALSNFEQASSMMGDARIESAKLDNASASYLILAPTGSDAERVNLGLGCAAEAQGDRQRAMVYYAQEAGRGSWDARFRLERLRGSRP